MPLYAGAPALIRANLEAIEQGQRPQLVAIGALTATQLNAINQLLSARACPPTGAEIVFLGRHMYDRRVTDDGYAIEDLLDQIESALALESVVIQPSSTLAMQNPNRRQDRYGNLVRDKAVFRCTEKYLRAELYTVFPKGDAVKPTKKPLIVSGFQSSTAIVPDNRTAPGAPIASGNSMQHLSGEVNLNRAKVDSF